MATLSQCLSPGLYSTHFLHSMSLLYHLVIWNEIIQGAKVFENLTASLSCIRFQEEGLNLTSNPHKVIRENSRELEEGKNPCP